MFTRLAVVFAVVAASAGYAVATVGVDVNAPGVRVQVGTPQAPPPPQVRVIERERVVVREKEYVGHKDNGKHKGHYKHKKHKKHKKHHD